VAAAAVLVAIVMPLVVQAVVVLLETFRERLGQGIPVAVAAPAETVLAAQAVPAL
jgi:hypothetical protein